MGKWLKYNLSQLTSDPIGVKTVIEDKNDNLHNILFEDAKIKALINYVEEDDHVFLNNINDIPSELADTDNIVYVNESFEECNKDDARYFINLSDWKLIEINDTYDRYYHAPTLLCISKKTIKDNKKHLSYKKIKINLSPYWNNNYIMIQNGRPHLLTNDMIDQYPFDEIIYYDYVNETATIENRVEMIKRNIPFTHISYKDTVKIS